ncbi:BTB/POZ domain-containing protein 9-like [Drosophila pseudoobscura]|uniref:BTB/POZ domain-containing protein 9-like n=1 Tax=Drosophila pseudoobscura pseudoobscura TaxID=46245 RepID=A0A6I8UYY0_DROPS|nr:BTB/POZ domain-containing protein 9 [Drosophila pseudoobscura]
MNSNAKKQLTEVNVLGDRFLWDMGRLCMNELYSDVWFLVEDQRIPAHRLILAARSDYFRGLLYGSMCESAETEIRLLEVPLEAFKVILGYLYSGTLPVSTLDLDSIFKVLGVANLYCLLEVESVLADHLKQNVAVDNVCRILETARLYGFSDLAENCFKFMDREASKLVKHDSFQMLSKELLEEVLPRDTFYVLEDELFQFVWKWSRQNPDVDIKSLVPCVRLPLLSAKQLTNAVGLSGLVEPAKAFDTNLAENVPYRYVFVEPGSSVRPERILRSNVWDFGKMFRVNQIKCMLKPPICCHVDVSCDKTHWERVGTNITATIVFNLRFTVLTEQVINFTARPVYYIRFIGSGSGRPIWKCVKMLTAGNSGDP